MENKVLQKQSKNIKNKAERFGLYGILLSLLTHISILTIKNQKPDAEQHKKRQEKNFVKLRYLKKQAKKKQVQKKPLDELKNKRIIETPLNETKTPIKDFHLGKQNHTAKKVQRAKLKPHKKAQDPSLKEALVKEIKKAKAKKQIKSQPKKNVGEIALKNAKAGQKKPVPKKLKKAKPLQDVISQLQKPQLRPGETKELRAQSYENLLQHSYSYLQNEVNAGFQEYLDDIEAEGETIDINTKHYRYIGYFTMMRKAIELVWIYPMKARVKRLDGKVAIKFTIKKDGSVENLKVTDSSGYSVLDKSIVSAIELASPFSPLPLGFGKDKLTITGTFSYVLN